MPIQITLATPDDVPALALLRKVVAIDLSRRYGQGHWSSEGSEAGVRRNLVGARVLVARDGDDVVGTLRLATCKPWAIDPSYFTRVSRPIYLSDMAVVPGLQRNGIGQQLLLEAAGEGRRWPASAIRLDAYDSPAGAGEFYHRCGYTERGRVNYRGVPLIYYEMII